MSIETMEAMAAIAQPKTQYTTTESYSKNVLGPVSFTLSNLRIKGTAGLPEEPKQVAPGQSPYIIASNEEFSASVDVEFNDSPLTRLLLCLGTKVEICFAFEGMGAKAAEVDLTAAIWTEKDKFNYTVTYQGTPEESGLSNGFYVIAAVATVGPSKHACAPFVFGYGYIAKRLLQVYQAFNH